MTQRLRLAVLLTALPPPPPPRTLSCFFAVSRAEAEQLLERNAGGGNVVLRPGGHSHGRGFSVSTRQLRNG